MITGIIEKKTVLKDESKIKKKKRKAKKSAKAIDTKLKQIYQNTVRNYGLNIQIQSYFYIINTLAHITLKGDIYGFSFS